jgi:hypothetical protein
MKLFLLKMLATIVAGLVCGGILFLLVGAL